MSRPWASVPNQNSRPGGSSATIRLASMTGSVWASHGAKTPTKTAVRNSAPPTVRFAPSFMASSVLDARVDHRAGDVDQRVDDEEEQHDDQDAALHRRDVALEHAVDQQRAEAWPGEQLLHHHALPHQRAELQAERGEHDHCDVAQHV